MERELDRKEFFREIKKNFTDAAKEVVVPLVEDDIVKMDHAIDDFFGVTWKSIGSLNPVDFHNVKDYYFGKVNVAVYSDGENLRAVEKICPKCKLLVNYLSYDKKFKCFGCQDEYSLTTKEGNLKLKNLPVRKENNEWMIGINK